MASSHACGPIKFFPMSVHDWQDNGEQGKEDAGRVKEPKWNEIPLE